VTWLVWLALAFFLLALAGSAAHAARSGWRLFKQLGRSGEAIADAVEDVARRAEETARLAERLAAGDDLPARLARLRADRARLALLLHAWGEARSALFAWRRWVPREKRA
jgi:hypothetical protein